MFTISSRKSSVVLTAILLTCCSPLATTTAWAMDPPLVAKGPVVQQKSKGPLMDAIGLYEEKKTEDARLAFEKIAEGGGTIAVVYLHNIDQKQYGHLFNNLPDYSKNLGKAHLDASLAYLEFKAAPENKKKEKINKLGKMVLSQNTHALSLFIKMYEDKDDKKFIRSLPKGSWLIKVKSKEDFYTSYDPKVEGGFAQWDCFDGDYLCAYSKKFPSQSKAGQSFEAFKTSYTKNPQNIKNFAKVLAGIYPLQTLWTRVAIENGCSELCFKYAHVLYSVLNLNSEATGLNSNKNLMPFSENHKTCFELSQYYLSHFSPNEKDKSDAAVILNHYASIYQDGLFGEKRDSTKQFFYLKRGADLGNTVLQYNYAAQQYLVKNWEQAFKYFTLTAEQDHSAQANLGSMYYHGQGCLKDFEKSFKCYKKAADQGNATAQYNCGRMFEHGEGTPKDLEQAVAYYKRAEKSGNKGALGNLSTLLIQKYFAAPETAALDEAFLYTKKAAQSIAQDKLPYINHNLSVLYHTKGGAENLKQAFLYSEQTALQGLSVGQFLHASLLCREDAEFYDLEKARHYFQLAANQGNTDAFIHLYALDSLLKEKQFSEIEDQSEFLEISVPLAEGLADSSDEELPILISDSQLSLPAGVQKNEAETTKINTTAVPQIPLGIPQIKPDIPQIPLDSPKKPKKILPQEDSQEEENLGDGSSEDLTQSQELARELASCTEENSKKIQEFRVKKQKAKAYQVLRLKRKDYEKTCTSIPIKMAELEEKKKLVVSNNTMNFVIAIFGQGIKINTFSNDEAKKAFAELGCTVTQKKGENSTILSYNLGNDREMELQYEERGEEENAPSTDQKAKYHNPHGHGDNKMYKALMPPLRIFLRSIGITPERLEVK